ncbi:MAG: HD domain-containing protein [Chloroflexi bacterium]|nr:HD domain-containing protein [Chloroflexota bacterium]
MPGHSRQAILKLGGLLHDIAKPETKAFDKNGRMRFFGHPEQGARKAARILRRLRFASREVQMVGAMAAAHLRPVQLGQQGPPTRRALYRFFRDCGDAAIAVLLLSLADHLATVGPNLNREGWRAHVSLVNYILTERYREETIVAPPKLISGEDLMADLGLPPGPAVGELLEAVREAQAAGEVTTREEALSLAKAKLENLNTAGAKEAG